MSRSHPLTRVLRDPALIRGLDPPAWEALLVLADRARLTASLSYRIERHGLQAAVPERVWNHFQAARVHADFRNRQILWEIDRLQRVLREAEFDVVVLKGGAYLLLDLPLAQGRLPADLDVLVARRHLSALEELLRTGGWEPIKLDAYDQRYYREWMHEIPPLRHRERRVEVDIHHALLPVTARLHADPGLLWAAARDVAGRRFKVLGPEDMVLHAVVHLFYDSDLDNRLRDLLDIDELLRCFSARGGDFWPALVDRARAHGLERPLAYALHCSRRLLGTPVPDAWSLAGVIHPGMMRWMGFLVGRALPPAPPERSGAVDAAARWLLYVRSHYLRMPLRLLLPHLMRKAVRRA